MRGVTFLGERKLQLMEFPDPTPGPHDVVVEIMKRDRCQDATKLGMALSGGGLSGKRGASGNRAYRLVASDVLGCMYEQGYLDRDEFGWYVLETTSGGEAR